MNKEEFLEELRARLSGLPQEDIDERLGFYREMIDDRIEDGISEEEAISGIGSVDAIATQIMSETPLTKLVKERVTPKRTVKAWEIVLLILGSPVWIPLVLAAIIVALSVYIVIWAAVGCVFAADFSVAAGVFAAIISFFVYLYAGNAAGAFFALGIGLFCAGGAILLFLASVWVAKGVIKLSKAILLWIKSLFIRREA